MTEQQQGGSIDLRFLLGVPMRHWKLVLALPVLAILATSGVLKLIAPLYTSGVDVLIVDPSRRVDSGARLSSFDVDTAAMSSQIALVASKYMALRVAKRLALDEDFEFQRPSRREMLMVEAHQLLISWLEKIKWLDPAWIDAIRPGEPEAAPVVSTADKLDRAAEILRKRLKVERVLFSYVLTISISSEDPAKAQRLATAFAEEYLSDQWQSREETGRRSIEALTQRLADLRAEMTTADLKIEKLKAQAGIGDFSNKGNAEQQAASITTQLTQARADVAEKRTRYEQARRLAEARGNLSELPEGLASSILTQLRIQQSELSRREAELRSQFGPHYPEVLAVRSQIEETKNAINAEIGRMLGSLRNAVDIAVQRVQSLEASQKAAVVSKSPEASAELRQLQPVAEANHKMYEALQIQLNQVSQNASMRESDARIITAATLTGEPSSPRYALFYLLATGAGGFMGIALAFLVEFRRSGFKDSAQVERTLGHPVIGMIPVVTSRRFRKRSPREMVLRSMVRDPRSRVSEVVRSTRIGLQLLDYSKMPRFILVTSAVPGEGKSATAMMLAASSALSDQRTILIDCDLRRKSLSQAFGETSQGLADVLGGGAEWPAVIRTDEATGVAFMPAGSSYKSPADLLMSGKMRDLMSQLSEHYDYVILDAPPLLPVVDASALTPIADKIIMVIEWDETPQATVIEAMRNLSIANDRIAGVILNKVNYKRLRKYGYGYGSGYSYVRHYNSLNKYYKQ